MLNRLCIRCGRWSSDTEKHCLIDRFGHVCRDCVERITRPVNTRSSLILIPDQDTGGEWVSDQDTGIPYFALD